MTVVQSRRLCCDLALHRLDFSGTARRPGSRRAKTAFGRHTDMPHFARCHRRLTCRCKVTRPGVLYQSRPGGRSACAIRMAVRSRSTAEADLDLMLNRIAAAQVVCSGEYRLQRPERRQPQMLSSRSKKDRYR